MRVIVNGHPEDVDVQPSARLLDVLRMACGLTGTKEGCHDGTCGACTVLIDGAPVYSCLIPISQVDDAGIVTIEGLGEDHPLHNLLMNEVGMEHEMCIPGMIMAALALGPNPTPDEVKTALAGNVCRGANDDAIHRAVLEWKASTR
jgi:aerobic-type carbon monoxide dehydrogenase small subunit (CoxS/CutS family)